jgi:hypothetical protein
LTKKKDTAGEMPTAPLLLPLKSTKNKKLCQAFFKKIFIFFIFFLPQPGFDIFGEFVRD